MIGVDKTSKLLRIETAIRSKLTDVNFDDIVFGKTFTDHMFICKYIDGKWKNPAIQPFQPITLDPSASVLHYGQAVFEGMKAFKDDNGTVWLFRPDENFKRLNRSAHRLQIPEFPEDYFFEALQNLIRLDSGWICLLYTSPSPRD